MTQQPGGYQQPAQQQYQQPAIIPGPAIGYLQLIYVGIILLMVSGALLAIIFVMDDDQDIVLMLAIMINEIGIGLLAIGCVMGAVKDENLHQHTKVALLIVVAFVISFVHFKLMSFGSYLY